MTVRRSILMMLLLASAAPLYAQGRAAGAGGVPIRIDEQDCIDPTRDRVWFTLRRLITTKSSGWFAKDVSAAVIISAQVRTDPPPPGSKPLTFPLASNAQFGDAPNGQVSLPIEYTIVNGLVLTQGDVTYTGLGAELTLINKRGRNSLGTALDALATITGSGKLPIPASPWTAGLTYLTDFANSAVKKDIDAQNDTDKAAKAAALSFNFDPLGECKGDFEKTGTKAILYSQGLKDSPGYVDINKTTDYCWTADLVPAFVLKAAKKSEVACSREAYQGKFIDVANNYVGFYLTKQRVTKKLGPGGPAEADRLKALKICQANGVTNPKLCPGGSY